jgi:hypothetical protein
MHQITGSGNRIREKRQVASFSSISTDGAFQIEVVAQKPMALEVEGDDNILPLIDTEVTNSVLHIKPRQNYSVSEPIILRIAVPNLEGIAANGAGKIDISGLNNEKFEIDLNGAPSIKLAGETKLLDIDTNGAAKIDANKLHATRAVVESKGVSKVEVYASEQLDATVSGPSSVIYTGNPVVNKTVNGPGRVEKRPSTGA